MADVAVFVSYRHDDDDAAHGRITKLSHDIRLTYKSLSGVDVELFLDTESISLGETWRERIRAGLVSATILIAFVSPLYLASPECREELQEFISVFSDTDSQKLLIPLLFTDISNIEERFGGDELWATIVSLQCLPIHELRIAEQGSSKWMEKVEVIAERMRKVLAVRDLNVPPPTGSIDVDDSVPPDPGTLELLSDLEDALPEMTVSINQLGEIMTEFNERVVVATPLMAGATTSKQRLVIANTLAAELTPISDQFTSTAADYQRYMDVMDPGTRAIFRLLKATPDEERTQDTLDFLKSIRDLCEQSMVSIAAMDEFYTIVDGAKGFSSRLDKPLQRLQSGILMISNSRTIFRHWLDEVADLES